MHSYQNSGDPIELGSELEGVVQRLLGAESDAGGGRVEMQPSPFFFAE